jgi:hypothetical protein
MQWHRENGRTGTISGGELQMGFSKICPPENVRIFCGAGFAAVLISAYPYILDKSKNVVTRVPNYRQWRS